MVRRLQRSALPLGARFIASRAKSSAPAVRFELEQRWRACLPKSLERSPHIREVARGCLASRYPRPEDKLRTKRSPPINAHQSKFPCA